jgi:UDP-2,4-diacetamido-2,4,6-trideoxy-beta-L-altropyranose hydrolase
MTMTHKNLIIRADADTRMGTGHIMRCIALAQAWQDQGGDVTFLCNCESEALRQRIIDEGFNFIPIDKPHPYPYDLNRTLEILGQFKIQNSKFKTWVVIDGYHFTPDYQKAIRENGYKLLVIDDIAHLDHYQADILLNQNIYASSLHYSCDRDTIKLLGCEYVLLRREFLKYKNWKREIPDKAKKILVTMGGSDPDNITLRVIRALNSLKDPALEVKIVAGPSNPNKEILINAMRHVYPVESEGHSTGAPCPMLCVENASNMPGLMAWADMAVSAGGSTCWELAFMGLPSLIIAVADNQAGIAEWLNKACASINLGRHDKVSTDHIAGVLSSFVQSSDKRRNMSQIGMSLVDGMGATRVVKEMQQQENMTGIENAHSIFG